MNRKDLCVRLLRIAVAVILLGYIVRRIDEKQLFDLLGESFRLRWMYWMAALATTYAGLHVGVLRWMSLLRENSLTIPFSTVYRQFFIGQFFNAFMLGACGGDMARAVAITRACPERRTSALATVVMDRGIGLFVTVIAGCIVILLRLPLFDLNRTNRVAAVLMFGFLAGTCAGVIALFGKNRFEHGALFRRLETSTPFGPLLRRAYEAFFFYRHHPAAVWRAGALSLLNLLALTLACLFAGRALNLHVRPLDYITFFPVITVLAAMPLTPGSLGVRENLFMAMFGSVGVQPEQAVSLSLAVYVAGLFWSLYGGLLLIVGTASRAAPSSDKGESAIPQSRRHAV